LCIHNRHASLRMFPALEHGADDHPGRNGIG
jgi:hypothetical protein